MAEQAVILLVEDQEDDVLLIKRAFAKANIANPMQVVGNGEEAIWYLKGEGKYANRAEYPLPDLMLLDLQMPIKNGFEVLKWIRQQPCLAALRVLVLTSSDSLRDVNLAYKLGANSFLVKPIEFENCRQLGSLIRDYWLGMSQAPEIHRTEPSRSPAEESLLNDPSGWPARRWID
jgi:CheY-like chemotaxis protein